jgi:predicted restriction endonuclease
VFLYSLLGGKSYTGTAGRLIKPWKESDNSERRNPCNGLLLTANLHKLFDDGLISFAEDGKIRIPPCLDNNSVQELGIHENLSLRKEKLMPQHKEFLKWHLEHIFGRTNV